MMGLFRRLQFLLITHIGLLLSTFTPDFSESSVRSLLAEVNLVLPFTVIA